MLFQLLLIGQLISGSATGEPLIDDAVSTPTPLPELQVTLLRGTVASNSLESFFLENDPGLLRRIDVQYFLDAKSVKLRRSLLRNLYFHGCIQWKFLDRLSHVAKANGLL